MAEDGTGNRRQRKSQFAVHHRHHALAPAALGLHILAERQGVEEFVGDQKQRPVGQAVIELMLSS